MFQRILNSEEFQEELEIGKYTRWFVSNPVDLLSFLSYGSEIKNDDLLEFGDKIYFWIQKYSGYRVLHQNEKNIKPVDKHFIFGMIWQLGNFIKRWVHPYHRAMYSLVKKSYLHPKAEESLTELKRMLQTWSFNYRVGGEKIEIFNGFKTSL